MHHSLQISEIVYTIVQFLSQPPVSIYTGAYNSNHNSDREGVIRRKALLSLSLTSRMMLEPCLDALWGCMFSARPLLNNIVPPEKRARPDERSRQQYHQVMGVARILENSDWTRFHYYASRVKGLCVGFGDLDVIFGRVLSSQSSTRPNSLLPNLRYLHWADYRNTATALPCIALLGGPNVTSLRLNLAFCSQESLYAMLLSLREACPFLEDMNIVDNRRQYKTDTPWQISSMLSVFLNVTSVEFTTSPPGNTLISLSKMPNLRTLKGRLRARDRFIMENTTPLDFPSLQHLDWGVRRPNEIGTLLLLLRPPVKMREFKTLSLQCDSIISNTELETFLDTLLATCSMQTLSSFKLDADEPVLEESEGIPIMHPASSDLRPLLQFSHIEEFRIRGLPVELDDAFVAAVATTWPRLRVLHLYTGMPLMSAITPAGLLPLARESRRLEDLGVSVGSWPCPILPPPHGHADMGRRDVPLSVHVHHPVIGGSRSREDGMQRAARLQSLWEIFPNAVDVEYYIS